MSQAKTFTSLAAHVREFIDSCGSIPSRAIQTSPTDPEDGFNQLALDLFAAQFEAVTPYREWCRARGVSPAMIGRWQDVPAMPSSAFKSHELTSLPAGERTTVFHSSGTTGHAPSRHFHDATSLALYEASVRPWFRTHLLAAEGGQGSAPHKLCFLVLAPSATTLPESSLAHMFAVVAREFSPRPAAYLAGAGADGSWQLDDERAVAALSQCEASGTPAMILGTAFMYVHLLDHLAAADRRFRLPAGSRLMETGGYKGRSREVAKAELHALLTDRLGLAHSHLVVEYGMSELGSQAYDRVAGDAGSPRVFRFPPWARARVISPEHGGEVAEGETGLLRVLDLANVRSVAALQTEDLAVRRGGGFELIGRAPRAEPRGCSLRAVA